jgi:hypothetical protein
MFYSKDILGRKSPLGLIWCAVWVEGARSHPAAGLRAARAAAAAAV